MRDIAMVILILGISAYQVWRYTYITKLMHTDALILSEDRYDIFATVVKFLAAYILFFL